MLVRRLLNIGKLWRGGGCDFGAELPQVLAHGIDQNLRHNSTISDAFCDLPLLTDAIVSLHLRSRRLPECILNQRGMRVIVLGMPPSPGPIEPRFRVAYPGKSGKPRQPNEPSRRTQFLGEASMMQKYTKCAALLVSLLLISAGVNYVFIGTAGGRVIKQTQQAHGEGSSPLRTSAVECTLEPKHCSLAVR